MYRRDISQVLHLLAILLGFFVLYQVWLKPTYFAPPAPLSETRTILQPSPSPPFTAAESVAPYDVPLTRLIDPGDAPSVRLSQIRDDLERGNYKEVEFNLRKLPQKLLATKRSQQYVAALWNNLGIQQEKFSGIEVSVKAFKRAVALDSTNPTALTNLTQAYWGLRDPALTPEFLQTVIRFAPKDPFPHLALADIFIKRGNVTSAAQHLSMVEAQAKSDPNLGSYYQQLATKIDPIPSSQPPVTLAQPVMPKPPQTLARTMPQESVSPPASLQMKAEQKAALAPAQVEAPARPFTPRSPEHFSVRFDGKESQDTWTQIRSILEYAHQEMSQKFGHVPASSIQVVLHTGQKFATSAGNPTWADSLYDAPSATIHVPTDGALDDLALLSRVLRHEFAHALLQGKMGTQKNALPTWLAEGLAIQLAEDPWPDLDEAKEKSLTVLPLTSLQGRWNQLSKDSLTVAYLESTLATQSLVDRYSMYGVRQVMNGLQAGQPLNVAMQQKLALSYGDFARQWDEKAQGAGLLKH